MKPTKQLVDEHEVIQIALKILNKISTEIGAGKNPDPDMLGRIIEFIRIYADKCHHGKEEGLLFPEMEKFGAVNEGGPIGVMLMEHGIGREFVKNMSESLENFKNNKSESLSEFAKNSKGYVNLLSEHIQKENQILYPMADSTIPLENQENLLKEFEKVEEEIGREKIDELRRFIDGLSR